MNARIRITGLALAALTLPLCAGCRNDATAPSNQLVQTVRIEPAMPREGETVTVVSTIWNRGSKPAHITYRVCSLAFGGDLALAMPPGTMRCAAVSATTDLAPGEQVEMGDPRVVMSAPGVYTLEVNHLLDPLRAATLQVRVTK